VVNKLGMSMDKDANMFEIDKQERELTKATQKDSKDRH